MSRPTAFGKRRIESVVARLEAGKPVRRALPSWGRVHIDRQLPYVLVYRRPADREDAGTERLAVGVASYVLSSSTTTRIRETTQLLGDIASLMSGTFGGFLIIELWADTHASSEPVGEPLFDICHHADSRIDSTVDELAEALRSMRVLRQRPRVSVRQCPRIAPPGMKPLFSRKALDAMGAHLVGIEVSPVYRDASGSVYPIALRQFARRIATSVDRAVYRFAHTRTTARPESFHVLGRRAFVAATREIDYKLAEVASRFDPLLSVTPVNGEEAWAEFRRSRFQRAPSFKYRPLPVDPGRLKAALWSVRPERVEDPTLMHLFRDAQVYLDRQIDLLIDVERARFLHTSIQLYGAVEPGLLSLAQLLLSSISPRTSGDSRRALSAREFCSQAEDEIRAYRELVPRFGTLPEVREDLYAGLLVSGGRMFIGAGARIPHNRADALIQHEVGTHVVTYHNGGLQPFHLLQTGLPGYDELQEGLAVLAEYLVGGLDGARMRTLAARVLAVSMLEDGSSFVETWRGLRDHGFTQRTAFTITTRVYRGGGLTKDAMYLRGLAGILDHLAEGSALDRLFVGKVGFRHLGVIDELLVRKVLSPPAVLPRYLERPDAQKRLARVSDGGSIIELVKGRVRHT